MNTNVIREKVLDIIRKSQAKVEKLKQEYEAEKSKLQIYDEHYFCERLGFINTTHFNNFLKGKSSLHPKKIERLKQIVNDIKI